MNDIEWIIILENSWWTCNFATKQNFYSMSSISSSASSWNKRQTRKGNKVKGTGRGKTRAKKKSTIRRVIFLIILLILVVVAYSYSYSHACVRMCENENAKYAYVLDVDTNWIWTFRHPKYLHYEHNIEVCWFAADVNVNVKKFLEHSWKRKLSSEKVIPHPHSHSKRENVSHFHFGTFICTNSIKKIIRTLNVAFLFKNIKSTSFRNRHRKGGEGNEYTIQWTPPPSNTNTYI